MRVWRWQQHLNTVGDTASEGQLMPQDEHGSGSQQSHLRGDNQEHFLAGAAGGLTTALTSAKESQNVRNEARLRMSRTTART